MAADVSVSTPVGSPDEGTTLFEYDRAGRLTAKTDPLGRQSSLRYDAAGRVVEARDALGRSSFYGYDELGLLSESVSPAGDRVRFGYDARGLLASRTSSDGSVSDQYAWDGFGRQTLARNAETTLTYAYDALDRPTKERDPRFGSMGYAYDADGRLTQVIYPKNPDLGFPEGLPVRYDYDARGLITAVVDPVAGEWRLGWDALGRPLESHGPDGSERTVAYTPEGFVDAVTIRVGAATETIDYGGYDAVGNPGSIASSVEGTTTLGFDDLYRVTLADYPGDAFDEDFSYDLAGNRIGHVLAGQARTYVVDAGDQLTEINQGATPLERFTHDDAGRRTSHEIVGGETTTYGYDALGRLKSVSRPGYQMTLGYDAAGRRVRRTEPGGTATYLGEWVANRGSEVVRLLNSAAIDVLIAEVTATGQARSAYYDGTMNLTHVAIAGALEASPRRYAAFGGVRLGSSAVEQGFAGHVAEGQSGVLYFRARHHDPATGRFQQVDPLGIDAKQLYSYAVGNPYVFGDPLGLTPRGLSDVVPIPTFGARGSYVKSDYVQDFEFIEGIFDVSVGSIAIGTGSELIERGLVPIAGVGAVVATVQAYKASKAGDPYAAVSNLLGGAIGTAAVVAGPYGVVAEGAFFLIDSTVGVDRLLRFDAQMTAHRASMCAFCVLEVP